MSWTRRAAGIFLGIALVGLGLRWTSGDQGSAEINPPKAGLREPKASRSRFEFEVLESFDAKYLGDTPGHVGRNGGLGEIRPKVSLGDPVYRDDSQVGTVSKVQWDRGKRSLEIEFNPDPLHRTAVGDIVWVSIDGSRAGQKDP